MAGGASILLFSNCVDSFMDYLCSTYLPCFNCQIISYQIQFVNCVCSTSKQNRRQIIQRHRSKSHLAAVNQKRRHRYQLTKTASKVTENPFKLLKRKNESEEREHIDLQRKKV